NRSVAQTLPKNHQWPQAVSLSLRPRIPHSPRGVRKPHLCPVAPLRPCPYSYHSSQQRPDRDVRARSSRGFQSFCPCCHRLRTRTRWRSTACITRIAPPADDWIRCSMVLRLQHGNCCLASQWMARVARHIQLLLSVVFLHRLTVKNDPP